MVALWRVLGPVGEWGSAWCVKQFGVTFAAMHGGRLCSTVNCGVTLLLLWIKRTACTARACAKSACTRRRCCSARLCSCSHAAVPLPSENVLNPLKLLLLTAACAVKFTLSGNQELQVGSAISLLQTIVSIVRIAISVLLVYLTPRESHSAARGKNGGGGRTIFEQTAEAVSVGLGVLRQAMPTQRTRPAAAAVTTTTSATPPQVWHYWQRSSLRALVW